MRPIRDRASAPPGSAIPEPRALPLVGLRRPASTRSRVVLPAPLGPNTARHSPAASEKETPATARRAPKVRVRSLTSTIGTVAGVASREIFEDIRLELATLAGAAQNAVSLRLLRRGDDQPLCANDRHRCSVRGKPDLRPASRIQADRERQHRPNLRAGSARSRKILGRPGA